MPESLPLQPFLETPGTILDVRSPAEFSQGHIPASISNPLFSNEERSVIGTAYKKIGQQHAIDLGLKLAGPRLLELVQTARQYSSQGTHKILCWRGGMRSGFVARLLESIGMPSVVLKGGYKTFRRYVLKTLENLPAQAPIFRVVGGFTGSAKTEILGELASLGEQVLDLEALASHRGSVFGGIQMPSQPTNEQFENSIVAKWSQYNLQRPIWIEDESRLIGRCCLPTSLYRMMQTAPLICVQKPLEERLSHLLKIYGQASTDHWIEATQQLRKRMGSQLTDDVLTSFNQNQIEEAFIKLLTYYDKAYEYQINKRMVAIPIYNANLTPHEWAKQLIMNTRSCH